MGRAKTPAWQLFQYTPTKDESGRWTARGRYLGFEHRRVLSSVESSPNR